MRVLIYCSSLGRFFLVKNDNQQMAWSKDKGWIRHYKGFGYLSAVLLFDSMEEAVEYAIKQGFDVMSTAEPSDATVHQHTY